MFIVFIASVVKIAETQPTYTAYVGCIQVIIFFDWCETKPESGTGNLCGGLMLDNHLSVIWRHRMIIGLTKWKWRNSKTFHFFLREFQSFPLILKLNECSLWFNEMLFDFRNELWALIRSKGSLVGW